jgi:pyruvate formate lyase activating enzyme
VRLCRTEGVHTALDTTLHVDRDRLKPFISLVDLFLTDIKLMDSDAHRANTGVGNETILENILWLAKQKARLVIRLPLVPGVTDTDVNLSAVARFVRELPGDIPLELINFNPLASGKYYSLNMDYDFATITSVLEPVVLESLKEIVRREGVRVI